LFPWDNRDLWRAARPGRLRHRRRGLCRHRLRGRPLLQRHRPHLASHAAQPPRPRGGGAGVCRRHDRRADRAPALATVPPAVPPRAPRPLVGVGGGLDGARGPRPHRERGPRASWAASIGSGPGRRAHEQRPHAGDAPPGHRGPGRRPRRRRARARQRGRHWTRARRSR
jgi:hypothetical protein